MVSQRNLTKRPHRGTTYADVAYCYRPSSMVCRPVCLSVTVVSQVKTAEPIEIPSRLKNWLGPRNHVLDRAQIPHGKGQFWGGAVSCTKMAEPIEMPFGIWTPVAQAIMWGCTQAPPDEYQWTVHVRRRCDLLLNYFDHLLLLSVFGIIILR